MENIDNNSLLLKNGIKYEFVKNEEENNKEEENIKENFTTQEQNTIKF